ncbi:hypothetical protein [Roseococcus sp. YIM B11640]|uniref:hypothetical protein n=1 Tax=Roseococcus sp. YIM B11640 TaxID=3133973 RepID=UPI003C7B9681
MSSSYTPQQDPNDEIAYLRGRVEALMKERVAPAVGAVADQAEAMARNANDQLQEQTEKLCAFVREKPLTSLGLAALAGFVLAQMMRR